MRGAREAAVRSRWVRAVLIVVLAASMSPIGSANAVERPGRVLGYRCELIAFDARLRALEQCTAASITPALQAESVEPVALPKT